MNDELLVASSKSWGRFGGKNKIRIKFCLG